jgi:hypothetical protein
MYEVVAPLVARLRMCDRYQRISSEFFAHFSVDFADLAMTSNEEVGRHILEIFMRHRVHANGMLRRNNFMEVRDADFQRGLNQAVENNWLMIKRRDRYTYILTEAGLAAGLSAEAARKL